MPPWSFPGLPRRGPRRERIGGMPFTRGSEPGCHAGVPLSSTDSGRPVRSVIKWIVESVLALVHLIRTCQVALFRARMFTGSIAQRDQTDHAGACPPRTRARGHSGYRAPGKVRRWPPADRPSVDVARGHSSQLFPWGRDSPQGQARSRSTAGVWRAGLGGPGDPALLAGSVTASPASPRRGRCSSSWV